MKIINNDIRPGDIYRLGTGECITIEKIENGTRDPRSNNIVYRTEDGHRHTYGLEAAKRCDMALVARA